MGILNCLRTKYFYKRIETQLLTQSHNNKSPQSGFKVITKNTNQAEYKKTPVKMLVNQKDGESGFKVVSHLA